MISSDCSLAVLRPGIDAGVDQLSMQAGIGRQQLIEKGGVQPEQPFARVQILKPEAKAERTPIELQCDRKLLTFLCYENQRQELIRAIVTGAYTCSESG